MQSLQSLQSHEPPDDVTAELGALLEGADDDAEGQRHLVEGHLHVVVTHVVATLDRCDVAGGQVE